MPKRSYQSDYMKFAGAHARRATSKTGLLTLGLCLEDDPPKEECQEGYSVLLDGLRSVRHWYVTREVFRRDRS